MGLGRRIACARNDAQLTQAELAEAVGRSVHAVRKWERSENEPSLHKLQEIADVTESSLAFLVGTDQSEEETSAAEKAAPGHTPTKMTHSGVARLAHDEHISKLLHVTEDEIDALRRSVIGRPGGSSFPIQTVGAAIDLLQTIRHLETDDTP
ncbi:MAG: helix-turn-helix transcriptional regulator [Armatimonadota bacterium]